MKLVQPSSKYKESFIKAVAEYQRSKDAGRVDIQNLNIDDLKKNFQKYINNLSLQSQGKNLPDGYVPQTTYWLIDKNAFIGRVTIRHSLTKKLELKGGHIGYDTRPSKRRMGYGKKILELAIPKAKEIGINNILITCSPNNIASKKIIEANNGIYQDRVELENDLVKLRYWIST